MRIAPILVAATLCAGTFHLQPLFGQNGSKSSVPPKAAPAPATSGTLTPLPPTPTAGTPTPQRPLTVIAAPAPGLVLVCNGSGGDLYLTNGLLKAIAYAGDKFCVDTVGWSRFRSALKDHADSVGQLAAAQQLANKILQVRAREPGRKIFVVAHSSGTRVALEAARSLPPNSIDRIVLLGSSVAFCYDLSAALRASCDGIDNFYSYDDGVLEAIAAMRGTADGLRAPAAGRIGFWLPARTSPQLPLYTQKLRQYPWQPTVTWTGHCGGHIGWLEYKFVQAYVLPLLRSSEQRPVLAAAPKS